MQSVEIKGLDELDAKFAKILKEQPARRRELHDRLGDLAKSEVDAQIASSGMKNGGGRLRGWQEKHVGSGGGYAAVRAIRGRGPGETLEQQYANSPGAITNYNEGGHKVRHSTGNAKRLRKGRAKVSYVEGYHYYKGANAALESKVIAEGQKYADELAETLGG